MVKISKQEAKSWFFLELQVSELTVGIAFHSILLVHLVARSPTSISCTVNKFSSRNLEDKGWPRSIVIFIIETDNCAVCVSGPTKPHLVSRMATQGCWN